MTVFFIKKVCEQVLVAATQASAGSVAGFVQIQIASQVFNHVIRVIYHKIVSLSGGLASNLHIKEDIGCKLSEIVLF